MPSTKQKKTGRSRDESVDADWKHLLSVGSLIAAVLLTLVLGAALQAAPDADESIEPLVAVAPPALLPPTALDTTGDTEPVGRRPAAQPPGLADLASRATADAARLSAEDGWTLQFMLACDPTNVRRQVETLADDPDFYLLPKMHDGRACFRVCWGRFATRDRAASVTRFPASLRAINAPPQPLEIASAVP